MNKCASTSWSSCLWKLCELVSNVEEQLCIVFMYTGTPISSPVIQKCVHLKCFCFVYDDWTTDKREKIMYAWQWKGEWWSDEIVMFLTLPWKMC
jgi:hypothetical protein